MVVYHLPTTRSSEMLIQLVKEHKIPVGVAADVAINNDNLNVDIQCLTFECKICFESYVINKVSIAQCS